MLGLMAAASPALQLGLLRMRSLQHWLEPQVQSRAWRHRRLSIRVSLSPLEEPSLDGKGRGHGKGLQENVVCLQHRLKSWSKEEKMLHTNYLEMLSVCQFFLPDLKGHHVLIRSDSMSVVLLCRDNPSTSQVWNIKTLIRQHDYCTGVP